jgi:hypothetical protein
MISARSMASGSRADAAWLALGLLLPAAAAARARPCTCAAAATSQAAASRTVGSMKAGSQDCCEAENRMISCVTRWKAASWGTADCGSWPQSCAEPSRTSSSCCGVQRAQAAAPGALSTACRLAARCADVSSRYRASCTFSLPWVPASASTAAASQPPRKCEKSAQVGSALRVTAPASPTRRTLARRMDRSSRRSCRPPLAVRSSWSPSVSHAADCSAVRLSSRPHSVACRPPVAGCPGAGAGLPSQARASAPALDRTGLLATLAGMRQLQLRCCGCAALRLPAPPSSSRSASCVAARTCGISARRRLPRVRSTRRTST